MMNIASIDIGTNTVLLLIAQTDKTGNTLKALYNEYCMPRIGKNLKYGDEIGKEKIDDLLSILSGFNEKIKEFKCDKTLITATNAFRLASNSDYIVKKILNKFDFVVNVISGKTEAEFAFLGALSSIDITHNSMVIDIGGGSTEIVIGNKSEILFQKSYPVGSVVVTETFLKHSPPQQNELGKLNLNLREVFADLSVYQASLTAIAIAGTATTIGCMINGLKEFNESRIEGSILSSISLINLIENLIPLSSSEIKSIYGNVLTGREDIILGGALILSTLMDICKFKNIIVSSRGIRYGAILKYLQGMK